MSSETIFEYRHKKFDHGKRIREDDSFSSENGTNSIILDLSDSSKTSSSLTSSSNPRKQRRIPRPVQHVTRSHFSESRDNELRQRLQRINISQYIRLTPILSAENDISLNGAALTGSDNRILIKTEVINETTIPSASSLPKRRTQSESTSVKIEPQSSPDIKIKEELIELNTHLPTIPRDTYEDICKFRSNMVRKFPKKERSVKEQERRDKNTYACRKSRRVKKIEQVAVEEEYKNFKNANLRMTEYAIRAATYFKELIKMTDEAAASQVIVID